MGERGTGVAQVVDQKAREGLQGSERISTGWLKVLMAHTEGNTVDSKRHLRVLLTELEANLNLARELMENGKTAGR